MFKKTLVAASLLMAFNASAAITVAKNAGGDAVDLVTVTSEAVTAYGNSQNTNAGALYIKLSDANYIEGNTITFTFSGGELRGAIPDLKLIRKDGNADGSVANDVANLTKVDITNTSVTYKIGALGSAFPAGNTEDSFIVLNGVATAFSFKQETLPSTLTMTVTGKRTNGDVVESVDAPTKLIEVKPQFVAKVDDKVKLDNIIDVNNDRLTFVKSDVNGDNNPNNDNLYTDQIKVDFTNTATSALLTAKHAVTASKIDYVLTGDFSFLDTKPEEDGIQTSKVTPSGAKVFADKITWSVANPTSANANLDMLIDVSGSSNDKAAAALSKQTFGLKATVTYAGTTGGTTELDMGSFQWGLNGSSFNIPYVPLGDNIEQFLWVTNASNKTGEISVQVREEDGTLHTYALAEKSKPGLIKITEPVLAKLKADGVTSGRVQMDVTVNAPAGSVHMYAAYKVVSADDRVQLTVK